MEFLKSRTIDDLGRIVLGNKMLKELGWHPRTIAEIHKLDEKTLVLRHDPTPLSDEELEAMKNEIRKNLVCLS